LCQLFFFASNATHWYTSLSRGRWDDNAKCSGYIYL
jgi:hypothetical protein